MRHYNGPSTWPLGHRWVSSKDGFEHEVHDCPPIGGAEAFQSFLNQPLRPEKILMTRETYNRLLRELGGENK